MRFVEKIKAHQEGRYDLAKKLIGLAHKELCEVTLKFKDFNYENVEYTHWKATRTLKEHKVEHFIAIHLRTIMERHAKYAYRHLRGTRKNEGTDDLDYIYSTLYEMEYHISIDDFHKITPKMLDHMEEKIGYDETYIFKTILDEFMPALKKIKAEKKELIKQIEPFIVDSLYEAIAAVDISKSEKEIVKFINLLVDRKVYPKVTKLLGTRTFRINGDKYYVEKDKMKFKKINIDKLLGVDAKQLSNKQKLFYSELKEAIEIEIKKCNDYPFIYNRDGEIINIKKRYFAHVLGFEESSFKKRLIRLQRKNKGKHMVKKVIIEK